MNIKSILPNSGIDRELVTFSQNEMPSLTYKIDTDRSCITGNTKDAEAVLQAAYLILNTERYEYPIYSHNYGIELWDLYGKPRNYVLSELKRRISEALTQDERIISVDGWSFHTIKNAVIVSFVIHTIFGDINASKEVAA